MFNSLRRLHDDPIALVYGAYARDQNPAKIDLGIGVYRNAAGESPLMAAVRVAQLRLSARQLTKAYLSPSGNLAYCRHMEALIFGADHEVCKDRRVHTVQTPGAGGGLRAAAELIKLSAPDPVVWASRPTWDQQLLVLEYAGLKVKTYPYYDVSDARLVFEDMMAALERSRPGDAVLLQGCCHNPTGADLTPDQWEQLGELLLGRRVTPFIDLVYQGLGDGIEEDVRGVRILASMLPEMILVSSSSKSFAAYRDRAGSLSIVTEASGPALLNVARHVSRITRSLYFMPPDFGAALVSEVLEDPELRRLWAEELEVMRRRIVGQRQALRDALETRLPMEYAFVTEQKGMFSLFDLSPADVAELAHRHSIYLMPDGRLNFAAVTDTHLERVADGISDIIGRRAVPGINEACASRT